MTIRCIRGPIAHEATLTATYQPCEHTAPYCIEHAWEAASTARSGVLRCDLPPFNRIAAIAQSPVLPASAFSIRSRIETSAEVVRNRVTVTATLFSIAMVLSGLLGGRRP